MLEPTRSQRAIIIERRVKLLAFLCSLASLFSFILFVPNLLVSFLSALVTYFLLAPSVDYMERHGLSRLFATIIPFLFLTLAMVITIYLFVPDLAQQAGSLQENSQKYLETASALLSRVEEQIGVMLNSVFKVDLHNQFSPQIYSWASSFFKQLPAWISKSATVLILSPFLAFFMLLNGREFVRLLIGMVPNNFFELALSLNYQISHQIGGFIRARLIESFIVGLFLWLGLLIMGFPFALVLALFASLLNIIPYLGPIIGALPAFLIAMTNGGSPTELLTLFTIYGIVQVIDTVVLVPFLVAKIVNLHPVTVVLSIIIGSQLMGILGMIICIPVVSVLKVTSAALYRHFTDFRT